MSSSEPEDAVDEDLKPEMVNRERHWVQDLFPPAFGYTFQEIADGHTIPRSEAERAVDCLHADGLSRDDVDIFAKLAEVLSPREAAAIKNVYRRVWVMMRLRDKRRIDDSTLALGVQRPSAAAHSTPPDQEKSSDAPEPASSCIWTPGEIETLRAEFRAAKTTRLSLEAELLVLREERDAREAENRALRLRVRESDDKLSEAMKANGRLRLLAENLKSQLDRAEAEARGLRGENVSVRKEMRKTGKKLNAARRGWSEEQLKMKNLEIKLEEEHQTAEESLFRRAEILQLEWEAKLREAVDGSERAVDELERERGAHRVTAKGLKHLRVHFSSRPYAGREDPPSVETENLRMGEGKGRMVWGRNAVIKDELTSWTYH